MDFNLPGTTELGPATANMLFLRDREGYADHALLPYNPSDIAAYIFVGLFALGGIVHIVFMFPYRALFPIPIVIGCVSE